MTIEQRIKRAREATRKLPPLVERRRRAPGTGIVRPIVSGRKSGRPAPTP